MALQARPVRTAVRTAIAIYGDDDLDTVLMQAKRVDAAFRLEGVTPSKPPSSSKKSASGASTKRYNGTELIIIGLYIAITLF